MLFLCIASLIQFMNTNFDLSTIFLFDTKLSCNNLQIFLGSNITLLCENQFNYSIFYEELVNFEIEVKNKVNIINNSNLNYNAIIINKIKESINTTTDVEITFTEFLNMSTIEAFIDIFQSSFDDIILAMEWSKYSTTNSSYCQWDQSSILPNYNEIMEQFEKFSESSFWEKVCLNNQACLHYVENPPGEIIIISQKTMIIVIVSICAIIVLVIISLYFMAKYRYKLKYQYYLHSTDKSYSSESSESSDNEQNKTKTDEKSYYIYNKKQPVDNVINYNFQLSCDSSTEESMSFNKAFFIELFGIGRSAGSIITETISVIKVLQRVNASKSFTVLFSKDCLKLFSWATNLFEIIMSSFYLRPFTEIEVFYCINYVIPIVIVTFITVLKLKYRYYILLPINAVFAILGFGFGYIQYNYKIALCFILFAIPIITILLIILFCCRIVIDIWYSLKIDTNDFSMPFSFALFNSLIIASVILSPFFINNLYFVGSCLFICLLIIIISFIIEIIIGCVNFFTGMSDFFIYNIGILVLNILTLLVVPTTELFVELINGDYKNNWNCIIGFAFFSLCLPLFIIILLILLGNPSFYEKYKDGIYVFFEIIDILKQVAYAFVSAYDITWACLGVEIAWFLLILLLRPYNRITEYNLQFIHSLIIIIINSLALFCKYNRKISLSFSWSISLVIVVIVPCIISLYTFFWNDFYIKSNKEEYYEDVDKSRAIHFLVIINIFANPIIWLFFGIIIPIIKEYFDNYYKNQIIL